ncbi:MAG: DUF4623 domain-containing protein [Prevotellaceae bacterium]|nr:DUF4623 domain-containing protein [Prevotellaceae bacterium]
MKSISKYINLLFILVAALLVSCSEEKYDTSDSPDLTVIRSIKIVNGGVTGTEVIVGTVNERKKEITFPEVHMDSDLSKVQFEAEVPERANLDSAAYDFSIPEGDAERKRTIAVVNGTRKREYFVTIKLDVPVWGADFSEAKAKVYDFSSKTTIYPEFVSASNGRMAGMDLEHVLIVSRSGNPHLLKLSELKEGTINPINLNLTGVTGGTYPRNGGRLVNGHVYICNLNTGFGSVATKVYHWTTEHPEAAPEVVASFTAADLVAGDAASRYGDFMSIDLDENGNGYIFMGNNPATTPARILRISVTGYTTGSEPTIVNPATYAGLWASYNHVDGADDEYLYTGHQNAIFLLSAGGAPLYTIPTSAIAATQGCDARIINFNKERYLVMLADATSAGRIVVYDITKGATTTEALTLLANSVPEPLFSYSLGGAIPAANASVCIGWAKDGNDKLYLLGAGVQAGFAIIEFPKKVKETAAP